MATTVIEIERKYDVDEHVPLPDLIGLPDATRVDPQTPFTLSATYYDTEDLDLIRAGITLRRRTGGEDAGWHLKLPVGGDRHELQVPLDGVSEEPPPELTGILRGVVRDRPLIRVGAVDTRRTSTLLRAADGRLLAEVSDDRVTARRLGADRREPEDWREWEVEFDVERDGLADELERRLLAAGAQPSARRAKLARILTAPAPVDAAGVAPKPKHATAGEVLAPYLATQVAELARLDPLVRADVPDAVHRMRVAGRRVRAVLGTYRGLFDRARTAPLRVEVKWLVDELGRPRDLEVLRDRLDLLLNGEDSRIGADIVAEHEAAHRAAVEAMTSPRYFSLVDSLHDLVERPPWSPRAGRPARKQLRAALLQDIRRLQRAVTEAARTSEDHDRALRLHDVRKAAKRIRYSVEAVVPVFGAGAERFAADLADLQDILGDHHDAVVAHREVRRIAERRPELPVASALSELDAATAAGERAYDRMVRRLSKPKSLRWLR
ncbi:CYTH and CHAD domain-containing protein [Nocardioides sp. NBC_00368]|uniref:CYTH and CHAD domain-containing protein n=1 Tax=Nocardioides sp. NBC_00368 TaxID=2976000 RepID=UPI002E229A88